MAGLDSVSAFSSSSYQLSRFTNLAFLHIVVLLGAASRSHNLQLVVVVPSQMSAGIHDQCVPRSRGCIPAGIHWEVWVRLVVDHIHHTQAVAAVAGNLGIPVACTHLSVRSRIEIADGSIRISIRRWVALRRR